MRCASASFKRSSALPCRSVRPLSRSESSTSPDSYIEALLAAEAEAEAEDEDKAERRRKFIMKDVRVFVNTILHGLDLMKQGGIDAGMQREETDEELILTIKIPKNREQSAEPALSAQ